MKAIVIVTILLSITAIAKADDRIKEEWYKVMRTCQAEVGGSQEDVDPFIKREMLSTYKSKCILDCVNEKLGYTKDGYIIPEKVVEISQKAYGGDVEKAKTWSDAAIACSDLKSTDRCERAQELIICTVDKLKSQGLDPTAFII